MKRWAVAVSLLLLFCLIPSPSGAKRGIEEKALSFAKGFFLFGGGEVKDLKCRWEKEIGLYVVSFHIKDRRGEKPMMFYLSKDGKFAILGKIFEVSTKKDLTRYHVAKYLPEAIPRSIKKVKGEVETRGPSLGKGKKRLIIISNPHCPHCRRVVPEIIEFVRQRPESYTLYYKYLPFGKRSLERLMECVRQKNPSLFWFFIKKCYTLSEEEAIGWLKEAAGEGFVDACQGGKFDEVINKDIKELKEIGVDGVPAAILGDTLYIGEGKLRGLIGKK